MKASTALLLAALLSGCAAASGSPFGAPANPALDAYAARIQAELAADTTPVTTMTVRNDTIDAQLFLADRNYRDYEASLYAQTSSFQTVTDLTILGLSSGAALASGEAIKTGLAAGAAAVAGTKAIVNADWYENVSKVPLIQAMRALRAQIRTRIEAGKRRPVREYSLSAAMLDVGDYASIDLIAAVAALTAASTQAATIEERKLEAVQQEPIREE